MASITIYHNPECGTSRNVLAMIRNSGEEPRIVEYLKTPPTRDELVDLLRRMEITPRELLRRKGTPYDALGLDDPTFGDDALIDRMIEQPILINRPIVVTPLGVRLCRPSETVLDILPNPQRQPSSRRTAGRRPPESRREERAERRIGICQTLMSSLAGARRSELADGQVSDRGQPRRLRRNQREAMTAKTWPSPPRERVTREDAAGARAVRALPDAMGGAVHRRRHRARPLVAARRSRRSARPRSPRSTCRWRC